jgi:hypothetical protein
MRLSISSSQSRVYLYLARKPLRIPLAAVASDESGVEQALGNSFYSALDEFNKTLEVRNLPFLGDLIYFLELYLSDDPVIDPLE